MAKTATKKSPTKKKSKTLGRSTSTAKKNGTSKAQAIRRAVKMLGRQARPKEIIAVLASKGITVSATEISAARKTVRASNYPVEGQVKRTAAPNKVSHNGHSHTFIVEELVKVKKLAQQIRGSERFKETAAAIERLLGNLFNFRPKKQK
jgi:hypothetical protein